ncbi:MAG: hypothetical protein KatS3mg008_1871 [Acidimicrobiales bacterium]|nr:MAG: hypothetical protein KatS3mg008_1871 [Acidimicrobiales bacterium]
MPREAQMGSEAGVRLPRTVVPSRYELVIEPDLEAGTFRGECTAEVEIREETDQIVLNAADLEVSDAWVEMPSGERLDTTITPDADAERITLEVGRDPRQGHLFRPHQVRRHPVRQASGFLRQYVHRF